MPNNSKFFAAQTEPSAVKAHIVSSYFTAWARVIQKWNSPMGYIDLFCGPGQYDNGKPSAPLLIIQSTLNSPLLIDKMRFIFNDGDPKNISRLKDIIAEVDRSSLLSSKISYYSEMIDQAFHSRLEIPPNMPVLSFVDPFGYKGLTMDLINLLISNAGSDCIFFFNYNRINMALSSNTKFDDHLRGLFGDVRTQELKSKLSVLRPAQREPAVIQALIEALCENQSNYVLPFKFYSTEMLRTSHFIVFVTKHPTACRIMKQIMYSNSAKDSDGIATFSCEDTQQFDGEYEQLTLLDRPIDVLEHKLQNKYHGKIVQVSALCDEIDCDFSNHFVSKNVKDVLKRLELSGKIEVQSGRKQKMRSGVLNMPDSAIILFK